jgi:hypothetical protein
VFCCNVPVWDRLVGEDRKVVGVLLCLVYWRDYFQGILPPAPGAQGIVVILENDCGQQYTYQVDGSSAQFVGFGDLHDTEYDYLGTVTKIDSAMMAPATGEEQEEGDMPPSVNGEGGENVEFPGCHYSIRVYPSLVFEDSRYSDTPWIYAVILGCLFVVTRQRRLFALRLYGRTSPNYRHEVGAAIGNSRAVAFPDDIRDRLYEEQEAKDLQVKAAAGPATCLGTCCWCW